ncbi:c-type cytochrome [Shimia sagamensis]|uniref:Cytochrome c, mono-and diheme variants n=1 Tax=Shimia sagamensis TaxID=1566352 RepID=A0ABY1NZS3_9RHOB|nr:cytochrome c [Shimia sagamensis]SMP21872.1 Cytochrome c, mono-and diheme variants [Shimia sagamensis]
MKIGLYALAVTLVAGASFAENVEEGAALYMKHCATCHGIDMDGNGPMAGVLMIKPDNLLTLSSGNSGEFPLVRVIKRIDGRDPLVSHGSPMPVYGDFFEGVDVALKAPTGQPIMTSQPVVALVAYLQSVQQ